MSLNSNLLQQLESHNAIADKNNKFKHFQTNKYKLGNKKVKPILRQQSELTHLQMQQPGQYMLRQKKFVHKNGRNSELM